MSPKLPSEAQAKVLARSWSHWERVTVTNAGYVNPTYKACLANGWLVPTAVTGVYPSGAEYTEHEVSEKGLFALECFLRKRRMAT